MDSVVLIKAAIAFAPALMLLFVFDRLDAFNLITARTILLLLGAGGALAGLSFIANWRVLDGFPIGFSNYTRYVAPIIEESLKAAPILALYFYNRIGFKLDAVIAGFAVGAGFATVENAWYMFMLTDANVTAWLVRGFGTAVMHGGATALFAVISHEMTERQAEAKASEYRLNPLLFAPGLIAAIVIHAAFNHFPHQPVLAMAGTLLLIPATLFLALVRSERATTHWLKTDETAHRQMLAEIHSGNFYQTGAGKGLQAIVAKLPPAIGADADAYIKLKVELVLRSEELILASQSGEAIAIMPADVQNFAALAALDHKLGRSLVSAIDAQLGLTRNDLWELERTRERVARA